MYNIIYTSMFNSRTVVCVYLSNGDGLHPFSTVNIEYVHAILTIDAQVERVRACGESETETERHSEWVRESDKKRGRGRRGGEEKGSSRARLMRYYISALSIDSSIR